MRKVEESVVYRVENPNHWFTIGRKIINMKNDGWHFIRTGATHLGYIKFVRFF